MGWLRMQMERTTLPTTRVLDASKYDGSPTMIDALATWIVQQNDYHRELHIGRVRY